MTAAFRCPHCNKVLELDAGMLPDRCPSCGNFVINYQVVSRPGDYSGPPADVPAAAAEPRAKALPFNEIPAGVSEGRWPIGANALGQVLGDCSSDDQVILIAGEPGIGKSTLALQLGAAIPKRSMIYVTSEESAAQVGDRAERLVNWNREGLSEAEHVSDDKKIMVLATSELEDALLEIQRHNPDVVVLDSINAISWSKAAGSPGSAVHVRDCAQAMIQNSKRHTRILIMLCQVTKDGDLAGPKVLEHLVDTVLMFSLKDSADPDSQLREVRPQKNRFGPLNRKATFRMTESGLEEIS